MDANLVARNAEACWHMMETCAPSLLSISRVVLKFIPNEPIVRMVLRAHTTLTQTASVLQMVHIRERCFEGICELAVSSGFKSADQHDPSPGSVVAASNVVTAGWDWRRLLVTEELLGLVLELAAVLHEAWTKLLPVLQCLHFELSVNVSRSTLRGPRASGTSIGVAATVVEDLRESQMSSVSEEGASASEAERVSPSQGQTVTPQAETYPESTSGRGLSVDQPSLLASLEGLFVGSHCLPENAVFILLTELAVLGRDVRRHESFSEKTGTDLPPSPHLTSKDSRFGLDQTLVVVRKNLFRLHAIWTPVSGHLAQMLSHQRASMRSHGVKTYTELSKEALLFLCCDHDHAGVETPGLLPDDTVLCASTERTVMRSYQQMFANTLFSDIKRAVLAGLMDVLDCCKRKRLRLITGWKFVLELLLLVPKESEPALLKQAFDCLNVICDCLLEHLPVEDIGRLGNCLQAMGTQDTDQASAQGSMKLLVNLARFLSSNRTSILARLIGLPTCGEGACSPAVAAATKVSASQHQNDSDKETGVESRESAVRSALEQQGMTVYELLMSNVLKSLLSLGLDRRVKVREEALQALFDLLDSDSYFSDTPRLMQTCRVHILPFLDSVAQQVDRAEEDGSLCWQHWLATWLSVVKGTADLVATGLVALAVHSEQLSEETTVVSDRSGPGQEDALAAWEGVTRMLTVGLTSGNMWVVREAIRAITVPMAKAAHRMPRDAWDVIWACMPGLLSKAQKENESMSVSGRRRRLAGPLLAAVVVEEFILLCQDDDVKRGSVSLAGEASLVSSRNLSALIALVSAATRDFRSKGSGAPASGESESGDRPETRAEQATRLYSLLVQAACERSNQSEAGELWMQVVWSLLQHLPSLDVQPGWAAGVAVPEGFMPLEEGLGCTDMVSPV